MLCLQFALDNTLPLICNPTLCCQFALNTNTFPLIPTLCPRFALDTNNILLYLEQILLSLVWLHFEGNVLKLKHFFLIVIYVCAEKIVTALHELQVSGVINV